MLKKVLASATCSIFLFVNVVFCHAAEANLWRERRKNLESLKPAVADNQFASLPASLPQSPGSSLDLLRQIPAIPQSSRNLRQAALNFPRIPLPLDFQSVLRNIPPSA